MICHGCGGLIGIDCFNPQECEQITRSLAEDNLSSSQEVEELRSTVKRLQEENEQLKEEKNELVGMRQLVAEIIKWTKVKDGRAIFTTSEETFRVYQKYLKSSELNKEEHGERIKCTCLCHSNSAYKHVSPCCNNGWIEMPYLKQLES